MKYDDEKLGVTKRYPALTETLAQVNPCEYELGFLVSLIKEFNDGKRMKSRKLYKDGTDILFVDFLDESDRLEAKKEVEELIDSFKTLYNGWDLSMLFKN